MTKSNHHGAAPAPSGSASLEQSEAHASEDQPGSFDEAGTSEKIVKIPPLGGKEPPIKGLDANQPADRSAKK